MKRIMIAACLACTLAAIGCSEDDTNEMAAAPLDYIPNDSLVFEGQWSIHVNSVIFYEKTDGKDGIDGKDGKDGLNGITGNEGDDSSDENTPEGQPDATTSWKTLTGKDNNIGCTFDNRKKTVTLQRLPAELLYQLPGYGDYRTKGELPSYVMKCSEKGYTTTSMIYELTTPPYEFDCTEGDKQHHVKIIFSGKAEMSINTYLNTMTIGAYVHYVMVDGNIRIGNLGLLTFSTVL